MSAFVWGERERGTKQGARSGEERVPEGKSEAARGERKPGYGSA